MGTLARLITDNPAATDAEIADLANARADAWQPVKSQYVLAWLGESARLAKLEGFVDAAAASADPQVIGLRSAVRTVLLAVANPATELLMDPASLHRTLLLALVTAGAITAEDADALIARGRVGEPVTAEQVATERAAIATQARRGRLVSAKLHADAAASALIDADPLHVTPDALADAYRAELLARLSEDA